MAKTPTLEITEKRRTALIAAIAFRLEAIETNPEHATECVTLMGCARALGFDWVSVIGEMRKAK